MSTSIKGLQDENWSFTSFSATCDECGRSSEPGDTYYSVLAPRNDDPDTETSRDEQQDAERMDDDEAKPNHRFRRADYCEACWDPDRREFFSFWKTDIPEPDEEEDSSPDRSTLIGVWNGLVEQYEQEGDIQETESNEGSREIQLLYLVTLMLMRKGYLSLEEEREENGWNYFIVRVRGTDDQLVNIPEPELSEKHITQVKQDLANLFESDAEEEGSL